MALIYQESGELDEAVARFKKVLYLDPDFILAHFSLTNLFQKRGMINDAARHRNQVIRLATQLSPEFILPGSDDLTAGQLLKIMQK
jgi:chemotaxis protein methyltransferase CheR